MHSASLPHLVKLETILEMAESILPHDLLQAPRYRAIQDLIALALQRVTTERIRLEVYPS